MNWKFILIVVGIGLPVFVLLSIQGGVNRDKYQKNKPLPEWYVKYIEPISETITLIFSLFMVSFASCDTANFFVFLLYSERYDGFNFKKLYLLEWRIGFALGFALLASFAVISVLVHLRKIKENNLPKTFKEKYVECVIIAREILCMNLLYELFMDMVIYKHIFTRFDIIWYLLIKWALFFAIRIRALRKLQKQSVQADE